VYAQQGFFSGTLSQSVGQPLHTAPEAWLNILALGLCTVAALFILSQYLAWKARRA
jgi:uncharacterized iron-regulated membrane protein